MTRLPTKLQVWQAPAKINLFLHITGRRADGYHELQTIFQLLDHGDRLAFETHFDSTIERVTDIPGIAAADDLVVKAAKCLQQRLGTQQGARIYLDKHLPMGGGLGGGSSDAATTLVALNQLWSGKLTHAQLIELGIELGADVPVFIAGRTAWAEGIGDRLEPVSLPNRCYLVVNPGVHVSTAELFSASELTRDCRTITIRAFLDGRTRNVFEPLVKQRYPKVAAALDWLGQFADAKLTGTGGCVFAAFSDEAEARNALRRLPHEYTGFVSWGIDRSSCRRSDPN